LEYLSGNQKRMDLIFVLTTPAKKSGGDKYTCETNPDFIVYFPQTISRQDGKPKTKIIMTIQ